MTHETEDGLPPSEHEDADPLSAARRLLGDTLAAARIEDLAVGSALHETLSLHARAARTARLPPERLVAQVKALARERLPPSMPRWIRDKTRERAIAWTIAAYYGSSDGPPAA